LADVAKAEYNYDQEEHKKPNKKPKQPFNRTTNIRTN